MKVQTISKQTQQNWWIDAALFSSAVIAALTGIYFLYLPEGGYQGGRNPLYNTRILFERATWDDLHTWSSVVMVAAALVHLVIHWNWVTLMVRRTWNELTGKCGCMNARGRWNLILNFVVAASFSLTAASGVYFLFVPGGRQAADPMILFSRQTWDLLHTWGGITFIAAAVLHFAIHWKWVTKVSRKMVELAIPPQPDSPKVPVLHQ